jgi:O-antigen ligase
VILPALVGAYMLFEPISRLTKVLLVLPVMLMMLVSMLATGSRGGLLGLMIGAGIFWLLTRMRYKYLIAGVTVVLIVGIVALLATAGSASAERFSGEAGGKSLIYRFGWAKMAFLMIHDHPLLGVGTGHFPGVYNRYSRTVPIVPRRPHWTHNSFLQTWAENGVFALMVYAGLYLTAAVAMLKVIRTTTDPSLRRLAVVMLSAVCAYFEFAGTSNVLENENYWIVFAMVTVTSALAREQARGHSAPAAVSGR